jgi:hypothetical protein
MSCHLLQFEAAGTPTDGNISQEDQASQRQAPAMNTINLQTNKVYGNNLQLPKPANT